MKPIKLVSAFLMIFCMIFGIFSVGSAAAYTLSLEATTDGSTQATQFTKGQDLYLNIVVDNAGGIAGCAFTLNYPANILTAPVTSAEGTPVTVDGIISIFPFGYTNPETSVTTATHRENSSESGKIYFAGAEVDTDGGAKYDSGEVVLFTVKFKVKTYAPVGNFDLSLAQTELWNLDAGYGIDNNSNGQYDEDVDQKEKVSVLVGALDNQDANWGDLSQAFPILLGDFATPVTLSLNVADGDSIDDDWEMLHFGDLDTADDTTDFDKDGYLDRYEQPVQFGGNDTDPKVQNVAYVLPHYDPATDNRKPYQVVSMTTEARSALPGSDFRLTVNYDVSNDDNTLTSLGVRIHFDSTKLTYDGYDDFFATGKLADPQSQDDTGDYDNDDSTDKFVLVTYSDPVAGSWPNETLPLDLVALLFSVKSDAALGITHVNVTRVTGHTGYAFAGIGSTITISTFNLDIDGNGVADGGTDGILLIRYLFTITGDALTKDAVDLVGCTRCTAAEIQPYLAAAIDMLDVDGNGVADGGTDGILLIRHLFTITGDALIKDAVDPGCTRCTAAEIEAYLESITP